MKKFLVITSITDGKDELKDPEFEFDNCDYFAFVDKNYSDIKIWEQRRVINFSFIDKYKHRRNAKIYKILSSLMFPQYEYIIWVDGNHQLKVDPQSIIDEYGSDSDLLLFKHPDRKCTYEEMGAILHWELDEKSNVKSQYDFYKGIGMPSDWGLFEMSIFIKKTNSIINHLDSLWWEHICKFSSRDQISLPFVLWKLGKKIKYKVMVGNANINTKSGKTDGNKYFSDEGKHLKY
jgi:hypothetical protein